MTVDEAVQYLEVPRDNLPRIAAIDAGILLVAEVRRLRAHSETMSGGLRNAQADNEALCARLKLYVDREASVRALLDMLTTERGKAQATVLDAAEVVRGFKVT